MLPGPQGLNIGSLANLPSQADQTILGNVSGASASPSALTANQLRTLENGATNSIVAPDIQILKTAPTISAGTLTLNLALSNVFSVALNAAITTMTVSNPGASGKMSSFQLMFTADGTLRAVTFPAGIVWAGGVAPTLTSTNAKRDWFQFQTFDGGTTWFGFVLGQNF